MAVTFTVVDKECHLPHQQTEDAAAIKPSVTAATGLVSPEGTWDGDKEAAYHQAKPVSHGSHPQLCSLRGFTLVKNWILALDIEVHIKGAASLSPHSCILPYILIEKH